MAAGDFSASTLLRLNVKLGDMFKTPNTAITEFNVPANSAKALLENQTAMAEERLVGNKCVGVKAWFIRASEIDEVSASTDCTTPGGNQAETASKNYDSEILVHAAGTAKDSRCDNEIDFLDESSTVLARLIAVCRKGLNTDVITRHSAAAQANLYTGIPATWDDTTETPVIIVPAADFSWDNLGNFVVTAQNNEFGNFLMLSGSNFFNNAFNANYLKLNDDGRAPSAAFMDQSIYFDTKYLDQTLGRKSTMIIDINSYIFWNTTFSTPVPTQISETKWVWTIPDPELLYRRNGQLVPVMYEVEMDKSCTARNALGQLQFTYKYYMRLIGGYATAPLGPNSESGTLEFRADA